MLLEIEGLDPFVKIVPEKTKCSSLSGGSISIVKNWSSSKMQLGYFIISFISNWPGLIIAEKPVVNTASTVIITDFMISKYTRDFTPSTPRQTPTAVKCDWVGWLWQCDKLPWSHITDGDNHYFVTFSPCHLAWSTWEPRWETRQNYTNFLLFAMLFLDLSFWWNTETHLFVIFSHIKVWIVWCFQLNW